MYRFRTYDLAKEFYQNCKNLKFRRHIKDQFDRALLSVVLNINSESWGGDEIGGQCSVFSVSASLPVPRLPVCQIAGVY